MRRVISSITDYAIRLTLGHTKRESDRKYRVAKNDSQQVRAVTNGQLAEHREGPHYINVDPPRFLMYTPNSERGGLYRHSFIQNPTNLLSPVST